jgi:hypothetical protein
MSRLIAFLSRLLRNEWREIASAPFDREIEVAIVDGDVNVAGTHWRYRRLPMLPMSCC